MFYNSLTFHDQKVMNGLGVPAFHVVRSARKESRVRQPGASGFCNRASDFFFLTCPTGKCCFLGEKFRLQKDRNQSC